MTNAMALKIVALLKIYIAACGLLPENPASLDNGQIISDGGTTINWLIVGQRKSQRLLSEADGLTLQAASRRREAQTALKCEIARDDLAKAIEDSK